MAKGPRANQPTAKRPTAKRHVIGVVSQKGGVGKSTLCQLIAREAASQGKAAKILDFDTKQMSSVDWVRERLQRDVEPAVEAEPTKDVRKAVKLNRDYDIILLDGAPGTPKRTAEMIGECDLIILPTGASRADLVPTLALARRLSDMKHDAAGPFFALCRVITDSEVAEARSVIGMGWVHHARRRADRTTQLPRRAECRPQRQRDRVSLAQCQGQETRSRDPRPA